MVWIVIALIMIVAFGPILWLMPSPRERRLSALRQRAYRHGMRVELRRLPGQDPAPEERVTAGGLPLDTSRELAAYVMPVGVRLRMLPSWRVLRDGQGMSAVPGWSFEPGKRPDHPNLDPLLGVVGSMLAGFPEDVVAVEGDPHSLAAYWLEGRHTTPEQVDDLAVRLAALARAVRELDARLDTDPLPGNI